MSSNYKISATSTYVAKGKPALYTFHTIKDGKNDGPPFMTTDPSEAKEYFNDKKKEILAKDPDATLNNSPLKGGDPFEDKSFVDTADDASFHGFEAVAGRDKRMAAMDPDGIPGNKDDLDSPPDLEERALTGQESLKKYGEVATAPGPNSAPGGKITTKARE